MTTPARSAESPALTKPLRRKPRRGWRVAAVGVALTAVLASALTAQAATAAPSAVVSDTFDQTVASGWGTAGTGGDYRGTFPTDAMSVASGVGKFALAPNQGGSVLIGSASATDSRSDVAIRLDSLSGSAYYATLLRYQPDGSHYRARLELNSTGIPFLAISRVNGKTEKSVGIVKLSAPLEQSKWYNVAFTVTGSSPVTIQASLTKVGDTVAAPQLNVVDSSDSRITSGGRIGWWGFVSGGTTGTTVSIDKLAVSDGAAPLATAATTPPASTPTPTPTASVTPTPTPTPTPPAAPAQPAAPAASSSRGSVAVGSATYAAPAGAVYVSNTSTQSAQNGAIGTPYKSVQSAVDAASAGATIVIRGGTYNESVTIPSGKNLTVQAYPKEAVWFDGSIPVTSWTSSGNTWVSSNWTAQFASDMGGAASRFVDPSYPMAAKPDQIFVDGVAQKQVASAAQVTAGTFAVDYAAKRLILGTNPSGKSVRVSNLNQAFNVLAQNTTLQGFGVRRYATSYGNSAAVRMQNVFANVRDLVISDNAMIGLSIGNNDALVERVTTQRNGMLGIGANAAYRLVIRDSVVTNNNVEKFKDAPVAGGIKVTRSRDITVSNVDSSSNNGSGMWFDESCYDIKVVKSISNNNTTTGIQLEISAKAILAGNQTTGGGTGVIVMNTSDVQILNSDFGGGVYNGISLKQDARRLATASTGWDTRIGKGDPTMSWVTKNITISNNVFGNTGRNSVNALDGSTNRAVDTWNVVIKGNLFNNKAAGGPTMVAWGKGDNKSLEVYNTPAALAAAKGSSWTNAMTSSAMTFAQMASSAKANSGIAIATSADLAKLLGWPTGTKKLGSGL